MKLELRPSSLPKLAECRCYQGKPGKSTAAARGTSLDSIIRTAWQDWQAGTLNADHPHRNIIIGENGGTCKPTKPEDCLPYGMKNEEREACAWALSKLQQHSCGSDVYTAEDDCRAASYVDGIADGTMDAVIPAECILLDFKTGQIRSYYHQMAAYSLSCMETYFVDEWTAILLFIDQKEEVTYHFTKAVAKEEVERVVNAPLVPATCEYCSWCANFNDCPITKLAMSVAQQTAGPAEAHKELLAALKKDPLSVPAVQALMGDPEQAARFDEMLKIAEKVSDVVRDNIKTTMAAQHTNKLGRWTISTVTPKDKQVVPPDVVGHYIGEFGFDKVLQIYGPMDAAKFAGLWNECFPDKPLPINKYTTIPGGRPYSKLTISKK